MVSGSSMEMLSEMGIRPLVGGNPASQGFDNDDEDLGKEIGLLLREQRRQEAVDRERELNIYRSGSAPPSVDGSLTGLFGGSSARLLSGNSGYGGVAAGTNAAASSNNHGNNGFLTDEELRADPAYLEYYYSHVNLNPRLPPPVLSKEDWRFAQRLQVGSSGLGGIGDRRKPVSSNINANNNHNNNNNNNNKASAAAEALFSSHQTRPLENDKVRNAAAAGEWLNKDGDGLIGLSGLSLGGRQKSFADIFQDNKQQPAPLSSHLSRPASRNTFDSGVNTLGSAEAQRGCFDQDISKVDGQRVSANGQLIQPIGHSTSQTFASVLGPSLPRSKTPDPPLLARAPSPGLPPVGVKMNSTTDKKTNNGSSFSDVQTSFADSADIISGLSGLNLSRNMRVDDDQYQSNLHEDLNDPQSYLFDSQGVQGHAKQHAYVKRTESGHLHSSSMAQSVKSSYHDLSYSSLMPEGQSDFQKPVVSSTNSYLKVPAAASASSPGGSPVHYPNNDGANFANPGFGGYAVNPPSPSMLASIGTGNLPPLFESAAAASLLSPGLESRFGAFPATGTNAMEMQNLNRLANYAATGLQMPLIDPLYMQYLRSTDYASQLGSNLNDPSLERNYAGNAYPDLLGLQKAYLGTLLSSQNQYNVPFPGKSNSLNQGYYANPSFGLGLSYPGSPVVNSARSASGSPGSPLNRHTERNLRFPSGMRNLNAAGLGSWNLDGGGSITENFTSSLLEEFKSSKTKTFELSEIAGHVVEFSTDQYGSRFIQQKLETATTEEKNMVFDEIMPQALSLMTDVFGNYVIQKFFEHGTPAQTRELANQLTGHVLTLSLQMYGCRVIQKAIEVVELDQQTKMVAELDGHVMRCVRDQNGNHVIQKCIECIPQDAIQFIISSFYDQVVTLSTHPYGCRVIQRVLEHCDDPKTQQIVMDEIMQCVCMLAQDQYGNYVVQHVLQYGKPHERSAIIKQLAGQIVQMSQQKFASNVVEKCLTYGGPDERKLLVDEMLGTTDENEPLQAMMKDQFANYVVQKVLETCDDQQRELILSRIKVHLNALKKYTYGKHIVARVEKLVAAGERRTGVQTQYPS